MSTDSGDKRWFGMVLGGSTLLYLLGIGVIVASVLAFGGGGSSSSSSGGGSLALELSEFKIAGTLQAKPGEVTLNVKNVGSVQHNLTFGPSGKVTKNLDANGTDSLKLGELKAGTYEVFCAIAGHKESGMKANLVISDDASATAAPAASSSSNHATMTPEEGKALDKKMMDQMKTYGSDQVKTEGVGNTPLVPKVAADGTKEFDIVSKVTKWEVEPGKIVDAWTYNGQVPGPWIKVNVGDKVRVKLTNELPMGTDIHFHGVHTPNTFDGVSPYTQTQVEPGGGTFSYEFVADKPAVGMYHAHMHGEEAVPNGMFGVFQIGDVQLPAGRTISGVKVPADIKPTQEIPMVLNDAGVIGFSLNGKSFPATAPVVANLNDWFIVSYFNEGLQNHPMHMHGFPQLIVAKDGIPLDQPYWADTILIGPGERYSVLVQATDPGVWVWHCHILNHVEMPDRLFGMATAVVVKDPSKPA